MEEPAPVEAPTPVAPLKLAVAAAAAEIGAHSHGWGDFIHRLKPDEAPGRVYPAMRVLGEANVYSRPLDDNNLIRTLNIGRVTPELRYTIGSRYPSGDLTANPRTPTGHVLLARVNGVTPGQFNAQEDVIRSALLGQSPALRQLVTEHCLHFYNDGGAVTAVVHSITPQERRDNVRVGLREVLAAKKRAEQNSRDAERGARR